MFTFNKAQSHDIPSLVELRIEFLEEYWSKQSPDLRLPLEESLRTYFSEKLENNSYLCFIAKNENQVAGIGGLVVRQQPGSFKNPSGRFGYLMNMYTRPEFRRKGICKHLLGLLLEDARAQNVTAFELHATPEGEIVYKQEGFLLHGEPTYRKYLP